MESDNQDILAILQSSFLFRGLDKEKLQKLAQKARIQAFHAGYHLIHEDEINDKIFLILNGTVKIYKTTEKGNEIFLAYERKDNYLGIMDLDRKPASATIETLHLSHMLILYKKDMLSLLQDNPQLWKNMYEIILAKLREFNHLQGLRLGNNLYDRTYHILQFLSRLSENNVLLFSHETIAQIVGATRPRVTEVLHILQKEKKIIISPKRIVLL